MLEQIHSFRTEIAIPLELVFIKTVTTKVIDSKETGDNDFVI